MAQALNYLSSLVAETVKSLPAMQETWVWSLGGEDPLEKGMATQPSILPWEFHGQKSLVGYRPWGCKESDTFEQLSTHPWKGPFEPTDLKMKHCILKTHCLTMEWNQRKGDKERTRKTVLWRSSSRVRAQKEEQGLGKRCSQTGNLGCL